VIAEVAHELSRPLAAVLNYAELALLDPDLSASARSRIAMVVRHAEACREAVRRSLLVGTPRISHVEPVDVNEVVRRAAEFLPDSGPLALDLGSNLPVIAGVAADLEAAVRNLLENGLDASPQPRVLVLTRMNGAQIELSVEDNGPGIAPAVADHLFEPFHTTKQSTGGMGLGLSIVRRIVEEHQGEVAAEPLPQGGARFAVRLPASPCLTLAEDDPVEAPAEPAGGPRVLLIDDDASMRKLLAAYLDTLGYASAEAGDGDEGLAMALAEPYEAIICDVNLPTVSGTEFHRRLQTADPDRASRVIFSTGILPTDPAETALRGLPNPRLQKPYRLAALRAALAR
jgi:CheY-like chemotaxis protein